MKQAFITGKTERASPVVVIVPSTKFWSLVGKKQTNERKNRNEGKSEKAVKRIARREPEKKDERNKKN